MKNVKFREENCIRKFTVAKSERADKLSVIVKGTKKEKPRFHQGNRSFLECKIPLFKGFNISRYEFVYKGRPLTENIVGWDLTDLGSSSGLP